MDTIDTDVLVVGAGPTGLMLANWLARAGIRHIVVDGKDAPTEQSRAIVLQARSLEIYDQLGIADEVIAQSEPVRAVAPGYGRLRFAVLPIGELGAGITPFSRLYMLEQSKNEALLVQNLERLGSGVRWSHSLQTLADDGTGVVATIDSPGGPVSVHARYCVGADGAASVVRRSRDIAFDGLTNPQSFFVCDAVDVRGFSHDMVNVRLGARDFLIGFPMRGRGHHRIIGSVPDADGVDEPALRRHLAAEYGLSWGESTWFATYRVHHRVAASFRDGAVFLAGDAAHVHSPVGGQGMNTGLQDAHNLALKLVDVLQRGAADSTLDRYEAERRPVAVKLVATTDAAFEGVISSKWSARLVRRRVLPVVMPVLLRVLPLLGIVGRFYGYVSQTRIHYWMTDAERAASGGRRGPVVGRRLRFTGRNFDVLRSAEWQVHSYGGIDPASVSAVRRGLGIPVHTFPRARRSALEPGTFYLVRPDGFVSAKSVPDAAVSAFAPFLPPGVLNPVAASAPRHRQS